MKTLKLINTKDHYSILQRENIPRHLLTTDDAEILKNVVLHSVATAFASMVYKLTE